MQISKKLFSLTIISIILVSCLITYVGFEANQPVALAQGYTSLGLNVTPSGSNFKLGVNESRSFTATATNGTAPFSYSWTVAASANFTLLLNSESREVTDKSSLTLYGSELTVCYPTATEKYVGLTVSVTDSNGYTGSIIQPIIVADPYTSPGYKFDASTATVSYIVQLDEKGWYRGIDALTGAVLTSPIPSINSTSLTNSIVSVCRDGALVSIQKGVPYGTLTYAVTGLLLTRTAGEAISAGQVVFYNVTAGKVFLAKADDASTVGNGNDVYLAMTTTTANGKVLLLEAGYIVNSAWAWSAGDTLWVSNSTAGALSASYPTGNGDQCLQVGTAYNATSVHFASSKFVVEHA